ncbi:MAG: efflux RND transporter periplasmic adaptor subunit [Methylococcaceae bacterium]|nr:efflux RND transporter periplasmic adaptor subunit [Methylococcaceae bacterium]
MPIFLPSLILLSCLCAFVTARAAEAAEIRAQLNARHTAVLASEISAKIIQLNVQEGERFKQGDLLAAFGCAEQHAQLKKAQAVAQAAEKTYAVNSRLAKLNSMSPLELEMAAAEVAKAKADIDLMSAVLQKCTITAPFSGRVAERLVQRYQYVKAGDPLLDILDDSQLELTVLVPSAWLAWLKPGLDFKVFLEETQREYPAKVKTLGARIDAVSQTVKIIGVITGKSDDLLAGMSGRAVFAAAHD